jgi:hypothetical protein
MRVRNHFIFGGKMVGENGGGKIVRGKIVSGTILFRKDFIFEE